MNILARIFTLIIIFSIVKWITKKLPKNMQNFLGMLAVIIAIFFPVITGTLTNFIPYAIVIGLTIVAFFIFLFILGRREFSNYLGSGQYKYWIILIVFLLGSFALSQMAGSFLLENNSFTGSVVNVADNSNHLPNIDGKQFLDTSFIIVFIIALMITIIFFKM